MIERPPHPDPLPHRGEGSVSRTPLVAGNWKMNGTLASAAALLGELRAELDDLTGAEVCVCPPFTLLALAAQVLQGSRILLGAQDVASQSEGAFTGEICAAQLRDVGCRLVIVGHSERRRLLGESDEEVGRKTVAALAGGLTPLLCIGETLAERDAGETRAVVLRQLEGATAGLDAADLAKLVLAYEPVWAIGTGVNATPQQAQEVHALLRARLAEKGGQGLASSTRILYGGSVKPDNAATLLSQPDVDGALVGGASLSHNDFVAIVRAAA
jgi:triosephosphate isomerase (TIM)